MAFKPRKNTGDKPKGGIEVVSVDSRSKESSTKPKPYSIPEIKSFEEQAIQVLNILESKGINIYDEERTPGMYLQAKKTASNNIINILSGRKSDSLSQHQQQHTLENENESSNSPVKGLLDFFNKQ